MGGEPEIQARLGPESHLHALGAAPFAFQVSCQLMEGLALAVDDHREAWTCSRWEAAQGVVMDWFEGGKGQSAALPARRAPSLNGIHAMYAAPAPRRPHLAFEF